MAANLERPEAQGTAQKCPVSGCECVFVFCSDSSLHFKCACVLLHNIPHTVYILDMLYILSCMYMYTSQTPIHPLNRAQRQERESLHSMEEVTEVSYCLKLRYPIASVCEEWKCSELRGQTLFRGSLP